MNFENIPGFINNAENIMIIPGQGQQSGYIYPPMQQTPIHQQEETVTQNSARPARRL